MLPTTIKPLLLSPSPLRHRFLLPFSTTTTPLTTESALYVLKKLQQHPRKALDFYRNATSRLGLRPTPPIHNLMLRTLAVHPDHIHHLRTFLATSSPALPIDSGTYFAALVALRKHNLAADAAQLSRLYARSRVGGVAEGKIADVVEAVRGDRGEGFEERLDALGLFLGGLEVERILQEVKDQPLAALDFFRWAEKRLGHKDGSSTYNTMLRVLARVESMKDFWVMVEEMKEKGHDMDIDTYIKLMRRFQKGKMLEDAVKLYEVMMDGPYKPAMHECGLLLRQLSLVGNPDLSLVSRVVSKYESNGYSLSKVEYDGILRSLTKCGEFDEAGQVVMKMKAAGFEPDNITYSQMVFGLCKAKRLDDALKVLLGMEASGCIPDVKTWTILIQGQCSAGEADMALACLKNMVEKNHEPDGELLDVLVKGLCCNGRIGDAHCLFVDMLKKANVKPRQATFKYLIEKLLDGRKLEEALQLLGMMKKHQFPAYADPFSPYISKFGTVEDAKDFLRALNAKVCPSPATYLHLFRSFFKEGRYSEAQDMLFKCPHHIRKHSDIAELFGSLKPSKLS